MARQHKIDRELTKTKRDALVVAIATGATNPHQLMPELSISDTSIHRWFKAIPDDEKMILVAKHKQKQALRDAREAAEILNSDGDEIDNDLRWLLQRLRRAIEACADDEKVLELHQLREMRNTLMDLAKVRGMFSQKIDVQINLAESPQFLVLRQIMLKVLDAHPVAKADFMTEMRTLNVIEGQVIEDAR
jgi:hypothetical protein